MPIYMVAYDIEGDDDGSFQKEFEAYLADLFQKHDRCTILDAAFFIEYEGSKDKLSSTIVGDFDRMKKSKYVKLRLNAVNAKFSRHFSQSGLSKEVETWMNQHVDGNKV